MRRFLLAAVLSLTAIGVANAQDQAATGGRDCFFSSNWNDWSAPGDGDTLYLRVRNDIYRLDLASGAHVRKTQDRRLINQAHNGSWICSAQDLDLTLEDTQGYSRPIVARTLTKLTSEEVAAIPATDLP